MPNGPWRFGLIVTGTGEREFVVELFRGLHRHGPCTFEVVRKVGQRSPRAAAPVPLNVVGTTRRTPSKDETDIGLPALNYLQRSGGDFILLLDDLEWDRREQADAVFRRYRDALDGVLGTCGLSAFASVHFLVMMLEAYYFACPEAIACVLGQDPHDVPADVETIRNPKALLKQLCPSFDEIEHGREIIGRLDMEAALGNNATCASLRTLYAWCAVAMGLDLDAQFHIGDGVRYGPTCAQIDNLRTPADAG